MNKIKIWLAVMLGMAFIVSAGYVTAQTDGEKPLNRAVIKVETLTCGACFSTISAGLSTLDGYSGMGANLFRKLIAVDFTEPLTREEITQKLSEVGYPGELKYVDPISEKESFAYLDSLQTRPGPAGGGCCGGGTVQPSAQKDPQKQILPSGGSCCGSTGTAAVLPDK